MVRTARVVTHGKHGNLNMAAMPTASDVCWEGSLGPVWRYGAMARVSMRLVPRCDGSAVGP
eukprot:2219875-Lingulodinium_polyedra.AAC.1